jgi:hypothetical protein
VISSIAARTVHAAGATLRHARCRDVRALHAITSAGSSRQISVSRRRRLGGLPGEASAAETIEVTVLMVAVALCAAPASVRLDGRIEHDAHIAGMTGVQFSTTVPPKPPPGVAANW